VPRDRGVSRETEGNRDGEEGASREGPGHGPDEKEARNQGDRVLGRGHGETRGKDQVNDLEKDRIADRSDREVRPESLVHLVHDHEIAGTVVIQDGAPVVEEIRETRDQKNDEKNRRTDPERPVPR